MKLKHKTDMTSSQLAPFAPRQLPGEGGANPPIGPTGRIDRKVIGRNVEVDYGEEGWTPGKVDRWEPTHQRYEFLNVKLFF